MRLRVMTILGTRPEIIRLSCVIARMEQIFEHVLVHTGQNYDYELNEVFFRDLELRPPDSYLGIDASTLGRALGNILIESERVLTEVRPDAQATPAEVCELAGFVTGAPAVTAQPPRMPQTA